MDTLTCEDQQFQMDVTILGGAGMMGRLIGADFALHGHRVVLYDIDQAKLENARQMLTNHLNSMAAEGYFDREKIQLTMERIKITTNIVEATSRSDIVVESVIEHFGIKSKLIGDASHLTPPNCVFSTNTMTLSISDLSKNMKDPSKLLGVRFLHPVLLIPEVELTSGIQTSSQVLDQVKSLLLAMGKKPFYRAPGSGLHLRLSHEEVAERKRSVLEEKYKLEQNQTMASRRYQQDGDVEPRTTQDEKSTSSNENDTSCRICFDKAKNSLFYPCGHLCACYECATSLFASGQSCPICRSPVEKVIKAFVV